MGRRTRWLSTVAALPVLMCLLAGGIAVGPQAAASPFGGPWCSEHPGVVPCIVAASITLPGQPTETLSSSSPDYGIAFGGCPADMVDPANGSCAEKDYWFLDNHGSTELTPGALVTFTLDTGSLYPTEASTNGDGVQFDVSGDSPHYHATITGHPARVGDGDGCNEDTTTGAYSCPRQEDTPMYPEFQGDIGDDFGLYTDQQVYARGLSYWTGAAVHSEPEFTGTGTDRVMRVLLGNSALDYYGNPITGGFYHAVVPDSLLRFFGIDDPSTLTPASLALTVSSGTSSITVEPDDIRIDVTGVDWSAAAAAGSARFSPARASAARTAARVIRLKRGVIVPTRPARLSASRPSRGVAKLKVRGSHARGSRIRGYAAVCSARRQATGRGTAKGSTVRVRHLTPGVRYSCKARAVSKAGPGPWSHPVRFRA